MNRHSTRSIGVILGTLALALAGGCSSGPTKEEIARQELDLSQARLAVDSLLTTMHAAAAEADLTEYMGCFAPDAIFLGTDAKERWNMSEFERYCRYYFEQGKGWTYTLLPGRRSVFLNQDADSAWFDELLEHEKYGVCRGTGAARRVAGKWQIVQYHLTIPVPNELAPRVVQMIRETSTKP